MVICINNKYRIFDIIFVTAGLVLVALISMQQWLAGGLLFGLLFLTPLYVYLVKNPDIGILFSLFINFMPINKWISPGCLMILFLYLGLSFSRLVNGHIYKKNDFIIRLLGVMLCLILLSIPKWTNIINGIRGSFELLIIPFILYHLINGNFLNEKQIRNILIGMPIVLIIILIEAIVAYLIAISNITYLNTENILAFHGFSVIWGKSNYLAAVLSLLILFCYGIKSYLNIKILNLIIDISICTALLFIIIIASRGAIIALLGGLLVVFALKIFYKKNINILLWFAFIVAMGNFLIKFIKFIILRFQNINIDPSAMARLYMWYESFQSIKNNLLVGTGPKQKLLTDFYSFHYDPHNIFLRYGVDTGIIGILAIIILLLIPFLRIFVNRIRSKKSYLFLILFLPSLTAALINTQIEITITSFWYGMLFWTIYALFFRLYDSEVRSVV